MKSVLASATLVSHPKEVMNYSVVLLKVSLNGRQLVLKTRTGQHLGVRFLYFPSILCKTIGGEEMQRKLVSVQAIGQLHPIPNADFIEKAIVQGWSLVVKKSEFQVGDLCAFFEIDSVLPEKEWSEFMRPSKFRVRTKKMRGVLSQGLALPLQACLDDELVRSMNWQIGDDLTDLCGVVKYEPPMDFSNGDRAAGFPAFVPKTDEMRIQSTIEVLDELRGKAVYIALKCDGTSATYAKLEDHFVTTQAKSAKR